MADIEAQHAPVKLVILPRTRFGMDRAGLRHHLETIHGPMVVREPDVSGHFLEYVHHYAVESSVMQIASLEGRDAVTVIRFANIGALAASKGSPAYRELIGPDEDNFRQLEGSVALFAQEHLVQAELTQAARKLFVFRTTGSSDAFTLARWTTSLRHIGRMQGVAGLATNLARPVEGSFAYDQFDEIELAEGADILAVSAALQQAARDAFPGCDERHLLTDLVRFI